MFRASCGIYGFYTPSPQGSHPCFASQARPTATLFNVVFSGSARMRHLRAVQSRGQGMTEYIIIVALIAVAAIAVYQFFGQTIRSQMSAIANEVGGKSGAAAATAAGTAAAKTDDQQKAKGLSNYADGADKAK
jgi:Flp pilus assembly pilin Flp